MEIRPTQRLRGEVWIPGDKSISHRSVMFGALAKGTTEITNFLQSADCLSTIQCFRHMGIQIEQTHQRVLVHGKGLHGLTAPSCTLDTGNSGTTTRLLSGILSGQPFSCVLSGDSSLNSRPMKRIIEPLSLMGADIESQYQNDCAPLLINSHLDCGKQPRLHGICHHSNVSSAQVKSAILLAGLYAEGNTTVHEPVLSRNHTELMLQKFGAHISTELCADSSAQITLQPCEELFSGSISVPGDISSAAYWIAAGLLVPNSEILIRNVGINPTRGGILTVCKSMGADITYLNEERNSGEPTADLLVRSSSLCGTTIEGSLIPTLIDELPMIAVLAACASGTTIIRDAAELKVKETDRIQTTCDALSAMGAEVLPTEDGMIIHGGKALHGATISTQMDHRIAMAFSIAGLIADGTTKILDSDCVNVSYPDFFHTLHKCSYR